MNSKVYRQADSRWKNLPYPTKAYSFGGNGCGACAVLHCIIEQDKYKDWTPANIQPYMKQYATKGHGTLWDGITKGLEHYGYNVHWKQSDSMSDIWKVLKTSLKRGVLLMGSSRGGSKSILWTTSGHYLSFLDWKVDSKGDYWFYIKDSGARFKDGKRDGWFSYKQHLKGDIRQCWVCTSLKEPAPAPKPASGTYTGKWPSNTIKKGSKGTDVKRWQDFLKWLGYNLKADGKFGKITEEKTKDCQKRYLGFTGKQVDGIVGPNTIKKAKTVKKNSSVTPTPSPTPAKTVDVTALSKCIDISYWQASIDADKAKKDGVDGVIIRTGYTSQSKFTLNADSRFKAHMAASVKAGLPVGVYHYSQAISEAEAKKEAEYILSIIEPYKTNVNLPVVIDWEFGGRLDATSAKKLGKAGCTKVIKAFCETVKSAGYTPMVYANYSAFKSYLNYDELKKSYLIWLAQYNNTASLDYDLWQYTSSGSISGISGKVDVNVGKNGKKKLNNYTGKLPELRVKKDSNQVIHDALRFGRLIVNDNNYHYGEYGHKTYKTKDGGKYIPIYNVTHSCGCPYCGTEKRKKMDKADKLGYNGEHWRFTYVCNTFVTAIFAHGGQETMMMSKCQKGGAAGMDGQGKSPALESSKYWKSMGKIPIKELKAGDILVSKSHMQCVYAPVSSTKVEIIEATSYVGKYHSKASDKSIRIVEKKPSYTTVYRYIGSIDKDIPIKYGEYSDRVKLWQDFLNWAGFDCGTADGIFGLKTLVATDDYQKANGLTVDGIVGARTLTKAKE